MREGWVKGCTLRLANVYGGSRPGQQRDRGILDRVLAKAMAGERVIVYGDGMNLRDYIYIDDVVSALILAPKHAATTNGRSFNIGTGRGIALKDAFAKVAALAGPRASGTPVFEHVACPSDLSDIDRRNAIIDSSAFTAATGWRPQFDFETGRLLDTLDELKLSKNTLVIYTSDNGPWNQDKYTKRKKGHPKDSIFWGEAGPLRNGKGSPYEAGYRLPCIVRWPGKVPVGRVNDAIFATIDFMPTFANLCGFEVPKDRRIDGMNQTDLILGKRETGREYFYFNKAGVRKGKWKYLKPDAHFYGYAVEDDRKKVDELYDLEADLGERTNLAPNHPKIVAQLRQLMENISKGK